MKRKLKLLLLPAIYGLIIPAILIFAVKAIEIKLTPEELQEITSEQRLGGAFQATTIIPKIPSNSADGTSATTSVFIGSVVPQVNNAFDLGEPNLKWRNAYLGTLTASVALNTDEPLTVGNGTVSSTINGSSTSTFPYGATFATTGGNVGIGTVSASSKLTLYKTGTNPSLFDYSNGLATSTFQAGANGFATSTMTEDFVVNNLYSGQLILPTDSGWSSFIDIGVSGSAVTTTPQGYSFDVDGLPILKIFGSSDALGSVYNRRVSMTDNVGLSTSTIQVPSNTASSTWYMGVKESALGGIGSCIAMNAYTGGTLYLSVGNVAGTPTLAVSSSSCENSGIGLKRD